MGAFWADAESIFETARRAALAGAPDCDLAILIGSLGGVRMLEAAGWALPSLLAEHGAQTVYRVTRERGSVRLEGRSGAETCLLRSESPAETARGLLAGRLPLNGGEAWNLPGVALLPEGASANPPRAETWTTWA